MIVRILVLRQTDIDGVLSATIGAQPGYVTVVATPKTGDKARQRGKLFQ